MTLNSPFQAGDYAFVANTSANNTATLYQYRPSSNQIISSLNVQTLTGGESFTGCIFNPNGDFYYWTGYGSGSTYNPGYQGFELYTIKAGTTTSTRVISDLSVGTAAPGATGTVSVSVASDGTIYALMDKNNSLSSNSVYKYTRDDTGNYSAATLVANVNAPAVPVYGNGTLVTKGSAKDRYMLVTGGWNDGGAVYSVNLQSGTVKSSATSSAAGPVYGPRDLAIDYDHPTAEGYLPVLVANGHSMGSDSTVKYFVTLLYFDPATGELTSPAGGNVEGAANALAALKSNQSIDAITFDNNGNLIVSFRYNNNKLYSLTAEQLGLGSTLLDPLVTTGTPVWTSADSNTLFGMYSLTVAPVPEAASLSVLALGTSLVLLRRR